MSKIITKLSPSTDKLTFDMQNVSTAFANAIRRICIAEVPMVSVDRESVVFVKNSSILHNDFLKNRLKLIPIKNSDHVYKNFDDFEIKLDIKNTSLEMREILAQDFEIFDNGKKVDPKDFFVYPTILFAKLKANNHLSITAKLSLDIGKHGAEFNPTTTCLYTFERDEKEIKKIIKDMTTKKEFEKLDEFKVLGSNRIYKKTKTGEPKVFKFLLETTGSLDCKKIIFISLMELTSKLENIITHLKSPEESDYISINKSKKFNGATDYTIYNEDDTIGNLLAYQLYENPKVDFAGYLIPHPLDKKVIIRIRENSGDPTKILINDIEQIMKLIKDVMKSFK